MKVDVRGGIFDDRFSYAVTNGEWHYLQEVAFDPQKLVKSRKEANLHRQRVPLDAVDRWFEAACCARDRRTSSMPLSARSQRTS